jgi:hypothetical protein
VGKSRERLVLVPDNRYANAYEEVYAEAERAPDSLRAGVEAIVAIAEQHPVDAREGLWKLQGDWKTWELLEPYFDGGPDQVALRLGAAIQVARSELASPRPRLRQLLPELLDWLDCRPEAREG